MSGDKARLVIRTRVMRWDRSIPISSVWTSDPNGTHYLVEREAWERTVEALQRYRDETPLGHQPHMIAHGVDEILKEIGGGGE